MNITCSLENLPEMLTKQFDNAYACQVYTISGKKVDVTVHMASPEVEYVKSRGFLGIGRKLEYSNSDVVSIFISPPDEKVRKVVMNHIFPYIFPFFKKPETNSETKPETFVSVPKFQFHEVYINKEEVWNRTKKQ